MRNLEFLRKLYLKSLTPFEVLNINKQFSFTCKNESNFDYLSYWKSTVSRERLEDDFEKYRHMVNLNDQELSVLVSDFTFLNHEIEFPDWVKILDEIMDQIVNLRLDTKISNISQKPFYLFFLPFIEYFIEKVRKIEIVISNDLRDQLEDIIYSELYEFSYLVLFQEFKVNKSLDSKSEDFDYKDFILYNLKDKYQSLFLGYPMLARKILTRIHQLLLFVGKVFNNLHHDREELESVFNRKLGVISNLYFNAGDLHNGESTVIIEFKNSYKLVYKPTSVGITNTYNSFIEWINDRLNEKLKTFNVLDKGSYGWMEFVRHSPCDTISDVRLYYERAGVLLGVAYMLNSKDFHRENVIASGNSPVLIDHETLLSPLLQTLFNDESKDDFDIKGTVLETSLIPIEKLDLPFFMYGFGSSGIASLNNELFDVSNRDASAVKKKVSFANQNVLNLNKPILNGIVENLINYQYEFKRGFQKFYNLILENKDYLISSKSPLHMFSNYKVRFINRQTKVYYSILKHLNKPEYLSDGIKFGIKLEVLARGYLNLIDRSPLLYSERIQMLEGNIPLFYIDVIDKKLTLLNGEEVNIIRDTAIDNVYCKIAALSFEDFKHQMTLISDSIKL